MRPRSVGSLLLISTTTTDPERPERTYPWGKTHPKRARFTRNRAGRGRSPSGWTAPSLRTTSSLNIRYVLMMFSRLFRLHPLHLCSLVHRFSGPVRKFCYSSRSPCHGSHGKPTSAPHGIFVRDKLTLKDVHFGRDF